MTIGFLKLDIYLPGASSVKDKRSVVNSIKSRVRNKYNVSIAETEPNNFWGKVSLGIATINDSYSVVSNTLADIEKFIETNFSVVIMGRTVEYL